MSAGRKSNHCARVHSASRKRPVRETGMSWVDANSVKRVLPCFLAESRNIGLGRGGMQQRMIDSRGKVLKGVIRRSLQGRRCGLNCGESDRYTRRGRKVARGRRDERPDRHNDVSGGMLQIGHCYHLRGHLCSVDRVGGVVAYLSARPGM